MTPLPYLAKEVRPPNRSKHEEDSLTIPSPHRCKRTFFTFFIIFKKIRVFKFFLFLEHFLFSNGDIFYPTKPAKILLNLLNSCIKRLLSDGFTMAAIKINSLVRAVALKRCQEY